jgi:hypothetical protein
MRAAPLQPPFPPEPMPTLPAASHRLLTAARAVAATLLLLLASGFGAALTAQRTADLMGQVRGPDGAPIAGVYVFVTGTRVSALTDRTGTFHLQSIPIGRQRIELEHLGYRTVRSQFVFEAGVEQRHDFELEIVALPGAPLEAAAGSSMSAQLRGFYARMDRGLGMYFTPEDIERMQVRQFTDMLRRVPGIRIQPVPGPFGTSYVVQMGRTTGAAGSRGCPVLYYLNGMPFQVALDVGIDNFVRPDEIAGIEIYSGSNLPPQFSGGQHAARCGVIVVWTHAGRRRGQ